MTTAQQRETTQREPGLPGRNERLFEVGRLFLKLGAFSFGGPTAHIALMQDEVVCKRKWLDESEFMDLVGATNLIPGPNSTELAIHIGHRRAGWPGLVVAGLCFILPAVVIVTALASVYVRWGKLPNALFLMYGIKPVIAVIVIQALWGLGRKVARGPSRILSGMLVGVLSLCGANELALLAGAGLVFMFSSTFRRTGILKSMGCAIATLGLPRTGDGSGSPAGSAAIKSMAAGAAGASAAAAFSQGNLFLFFLKVGSVLYGSGYVLLAFLKSDLVDRWHWLSESQLLDAVAVGQFTPGPVFTTATFIGYVLGGMGGAALATVGIFLPAFIFVAISGPMIPRIRRSPSAGAFLDGVNVASLALMATVTFQLAQVALTDPYSVALAGISAVMLFRSRLNSAWLVIGGGLAGLAWRLLTG